MNYREVISTKKARKTAANAVRALGEEYGWECINGYGAPGPREEKVALRKGDCCVTMHFEGGSKVGAFLAHWYEDGATGFAPYTNAFAAAIHGSCNPYHHAKATTCEYSFENFLASLRGGFVHLSGGDKK